MLILLRKVGAHPFEPSDLTTAASFAAQAALATQLAAGRHAHDLAALLDERERIARDLHDLAIQQLFATGLQLETVRRAGGSRRGRDRADRDRRARRSTTSTARCGRSGGSCTTCATRTPPPASSNACGGRRRSRGRASASHRPSSSASTVRPSSRAASTRTGWTSASDRTSPSDVVAVVREGLANAARHARASSVTVRVRVVGAAPQGSVRVEVEDDGVGLPADGGRSSGTRNLARTRPRARRDRRARRPADGPGTLLTWEAPLGLTAQPPGSTRQPARARDATHAATWVRRCSPIFASTDVMWFFTVFSTTPSRSAISRLDSPSPMSSTTRSSLGVRLVRRVVVPGLVPGDRPLVEQDPPGGDGADHLRDLRTAHGLQQVRGRPVVERGRQRVVVVERRQDDRPRLGQPLAQRAQELDARCRPAAAGPRARSAGAPGRRAAHRPPPSRPRRRRSCPRPGPPPPRCRDGPPRDRRRSSR